MKLGNTILISVISSPINRSVYYTRAVFVFRAISPKRTIPIGLP